jgi:CubicO group peptidase (beta-lactamase class C family)
MNLLIPVLLASWLSPVPGEACAAPPERHAEAMKAIIAATNTGEARKIRSAASAWWLFADTSRRVSDRVLSQLGVEHWKSGRWDADTTCASGADTAYILARNALAQETDSLVFVFDMSGRVKSLSVVTGVRVPVADSSTRSDLARLRALRRYLARLRAAGAFSGAVLLQRDGRTLFADSGGREQRPDGRAIGILSRINIASVGKMFTATSIMQLAVRGALSLDDSLGRFYPDSGIGSALKPVRVRHVLSHMSGIRDSRDTLYSSPGSVFVYSNLDYVLLGEILERVSGERFEDYFAEHVFRPARMTLTSRPVLSRPVDYLAMGYVPQFTDTGLVLAPNELLHTLPGNAAGALYSSALDLARFGHALRSGALVRRDLVDSMRLNRNAKPQSAYGYGVLLWRGSGIWGHAGDLPGTDADLEIFEPAGIVAVVLSNISGVNNPIRRRIARLWGITSR